MRSPRKWRSWVLCRCTGRGAGLRGDATQCPLYATSGHSGPASNLFELTTCNRARNAVSLGTCRSFVIVKVYIVGVLSKVHDGEASSHHTGLPARYASSPSGSHFVCGYCLLSRLQFLLRLYHQRFVGSRCKAACDLFGTASEPILFDTRQRGRRLRRRNCLDARQRCWGEMGRENPPYRAKCPLLSSSPSVVGKTTFSQGNVGLIGR